ncbi:MAG TPA: class I SAM-dependent methyltransferase [Acetobacteraceae bacterium]|nr:class I SAM-dependent methyltransferase [Acetobacteraceae bacterium]
MGDIFRREAAASPQPFTGERLTGALSGQTEIEHYHRYLFARGFCAGLDVLDVASGEGYGSAQLAQIARSVVGVEYATDAVLGASANFTRPNLRFLCADARALPLADQSIDVAVSFETIEHFDKQDAFLGELRRILRPDGCLIVSTPDRDNYSPAGSRANPYHVRELSRTEFVTLLRQFFAEVEVVLQRPLIGSALLGETGSDLPPQVFDRRGATHFEACNGLPRAPYIVAVASQKKRPPLPASLYVDRSDLDTDAHAVRTLTAELATRSAELDIRNQQLAAHVAELNARREEMAEARAIIRSAEQTCAEALARGAALSQEISLLSGSLRMFLRGYLPQLRRRFFG